jgi:hypothetical protein
MSIWFDSLTIIILALSWWIALSAYPNLPERIPTHFGFTGEADGWGARWTIFLMPLIGTLMFVLDYWLFNRVVVGDSRPIPPAVKTPLHLLLLELSVVFTFITWRTSEVAFGRARGLGPWFLPVTLFAVLGTCGWMWALGHGN